MRYQVGRDAASEDFDGDSIVLDLSNGKYYSFSDSGSLIWQALSKGADSEAVLSAAKDTAWGASLDGFVAELVENKLLVAAPDRGADLPEDLRGRLAAAAEAASLSVFDDLADLFLADPIHDVQDEAGWPIKKEA